MAEPTISCPSCGKKIPLTRALRTEIEASVREDYERRLGEEIDRARTQAGKDAEKKSAQWAKRTKQIESVTFNIAGMYGDLQGLVPALPSIARLELPETEMEAV